MSILSSTSFRAVRVALRLFIGLSAAVCLAPLSIGVLSAQGQPPADRLEPATSKPPALPGQAADSDDADTFSSSLWTGGRYRLTPSDVIELHFPYVPEFDQTVTVQPDGYVSLRVISDVHVQGRTIPEVRTLLSDSYAGILKDPVVNVVLKEFEKPYFVIAGEVSNPGKYELRGATTLTQALLQAGGNKWSAKSSQVLLFRRFGAEWLEVKQYNVKKMYASRDLSEDPILRPGDTILLPKRIIATIAPLIPRPGLGLYLNAF